MSNLDIINKTVEITVARMSNTNLPINADGGKDTAEFMQKIYEKLSELNSKNH